MTPVPRGKSLAAVSEAVLADIDRVWSQSTRRDGQNPAERWQEESQRLRPLPETPFEARRLRLASISRQAMIHLDGARVLARFIGAVSEHGPKPVAEALLAALDGDRFDLLALRPKRKAPAQVKVPESLAGYEVASASAAEFDLLLTAGGLL